MTADPDLRQCSRTRAGDGLFAATYRWTPASSTGSPTTSLRSSGDMQLDGDRDVTKTIVRARERESTFVRRPLARALPASPSLRQPAEERREPFTETGIREMNLRLSPQMGKRQ